MVNQGLQSKELLTRAEVLGLDIATMCGYYSTHEAGAWNFYESKSPE